MSERKYRPGEDPETVLYIHIRNVFDPDYSTSETNDYPWAARVVVRGHTRESYHTEELDALQWAQDTAAALLIKTAIKES